MSENVVENHESPSATKKGMGKRLDAAGWGLFFIWAGVSLLMDLGWGVGLIGVAAIILLGQTVRLHFGLRLEKFWVAVGVLFVLGGIWELFQVQVGLVPILLIAAAWGTVGLAVPADLAHRSETEIPPCHFVLKYKMSSLKLSISNLF